MIKNYMRIGKANARKRARKKARWYSKPISVRGLPLAGKAYGLAKQIQPELKNTVSHEDYESSFIISDVPGFKGTGATNYDVLQYANVGTAATPNTVGSSSSSPILYTMHHLSTGDNPYNRTGDEIIAQRFILQGFLILVKKTALPVLGIYWRMMIIQFHDYIEESLANATAQLVSKVLKIDHSNTIEATSTNTTGQALSDPLRPIFSEFRSTKEVVEPKERKRDFSVLYDANGHFEEQEDPAQNEMTRLNISLDLGGKTIRYQEGSDVPENPIIVLLWATNESGQDTNSGSYLQLHWWAREVFWDV